MRMDSNASRDSDSSMGAHSNQLERSNSDPLDGRDHHRVLSNVSSGSSGEQRRKKHHVPRLPGLHMPHLHRHSSRGKSRPTSPRRSDGARTKQD